MKLHREFLRLIGFPPADKNKRRPLELNGGVLVSFVHAYDDDVVTPDNALMPALWRHHGGQDVIARFPFPRTPSDFHKLPIPVSGETPSRETSPLTKLPRFGLMGLCPVGDRVYAGSWNGVYEIDRPSLEVRRFITNRLMCDLHGIAADDDFLYSCLTCRDALVISDHDGRIVETFSIGPDLSVEVDPVLQSEDWRFVSKQVRGSVGLFHFNHLQRLDDEMYLTSRSLGCFVVLNLQTRRCYLRPMNAKSPLLIHDGIARNGDFVFTSIDGKVIIAEEGSRSGGIYKRDLVVRSEITLANQPNWCRGIDINDEGVILANVDGRYGEGASFGVQGVNAEGEYLGEIRLPYARAGFDYPILYMTGFDILAEPAAAARRAA